MGTRGSKKRKADRGRGVSESSGGGGGVSKSSGGGVSKSIGGGVSKSSGGGISEIGGSCDRILNLNGRPPYLVLTGGTKSTSLFSLSGDSSVVFVPDPAHLFLGSSGNLLVTVDDRARMYLVNPVTREQAALPDITTMGIHNKRFNFTVEMDTFMQIRFGGQLASWGSRWKPQPLTFSLAAEQMRQFFYRKVVLSASPHPDSYTAMLILQKDFGAPAFASAKDAVWRIAYSPGGIEDAIHFKGQFYSITYSGDVEVWKDDAEAAGKMRSEMAAPSLPAHVEFPFNTKGPWKIGIHWAIALSDDHLVEYPLPKLKNDGLSRRKYLVETLDGRLMVVVKYSQEALMTWKCAFKIYILDADGDGAGEQWKESKNIGKCALFVGLNNSLCVSTRQHPNIKSNRIYFTDDELEHAVWRGEVRNQCLYNTGGYENRCIGVYNIKKGILNKVQLSMEEASFWPPAVWFSPS